MKKLYETLIILLPWSVLIGNLQFHFQRLLPKQDWFKGEYFFDFFTFTDLFVTFFLLISIFGLITKKIKFNQKKLPLAVKISTALLLIAGLAQIWRVDLWEPILTTPSEYFRSMIVYPLLTIILIFKTAENQLIEKLLKSYVAVAFILASLSLIQFLTGIFPGEAKDFMGRLTWPYLDFLTLKAGSANWLAFFITPALLFSTFKLVPVIFRNKTIATKEFIFWLLSALILAITLLLTQSYGAYLAIALALIVFCFRSLKKRQILLFSVIILTVAAGAFAVISQSKKFQILTNQVDYRFDNSAKVREDINIVNLAIIKENPLMGVGLNQYQSYFRQNHERILGYQLNESHFPPHAHNFLLSFWTNLGLFGILAILTLIITIFWKSGFSAKNPAVFVLLAIMIHGLIDSYYWRQEIAYIFWFVILFCLTYLPDLSKKDSPSTDCTFS